MLRINIRIGLLFLSLALLVGLGSATGASLAQRSQGPGLDLWASVSPTEVASGEGFLTALTLRNNATEPATVDAVRVQLPAGASYVGQALGSDVAARAEVQGDGLRWTGPFTLEADAEMTIRFWSVASKQAAPGEYSLQAAAVAGEESLASAELRLPVVTRDSSEPFPARPSTAETSPAMPSAVNISKTALPTLISPGSSVAYTVMFSNDGTSPITLEDIADELPAGFEYVGLAHGSQVADEPIDPEEPEIVWQGSFVVPAEGTLVLRYWVWVPKGGGYDGEIPYTNSVTANNGAIGPEHAEVFIDINKVYMPLVLLDYTSPYFTITKNAVPKSVTEGGVGEVVTYTVQLANGGDDPGVLNTIEDTLPPGFVFLEEVSNIGGTPPSSGATGKISWSGPYSVPAGSELTLVYRVRAINTEGTYVNSATATTLVGRPPETPATATVTVGPDILFEDDFEDGIGAWTPFTNYWRLNEEQWFWDQGGGYGGSNGYTHYWAAGVPDPEDGAEDALTMYLGEGSEQWTNYRFSTRFEILAGPKAGVWFLGEYRDVETPGQWFTGYYVMVGVNAVGPDTVSLLQMRTEEEPGKDPPPPWYYLYHFSNPVELTSKVLATDLLRNSWYRLTVEVEKIDAGSVRINVWVENERAIVDYVDNSGSVFTEGTIGLRTYGSPNVGFAVVRFDDVLVEPLD